MPADVAIATTFGPNILESFRVWTDEVPGSEEVGIADLMSFLTVRHSTVYRYSEPVGLGEHRMMFRPRESHDLRLIRTSLAITPRARVTCVGCTIRSITPWPSPRFEGTTSRAALRKHGDAGTFRDLAARNIRSKSTRATYPFRYSDEDFPNLMRALWRTTIRARAFRNGRCSFWIRRKPRAR